MAKMETDVPQCLCVRATSAESHAKAPTHQFPQAEGSCDAEFFAFQCRTFAHSLGIVFGDRLQTGDWSDNNVEKPQALTQQNVLVAQHPPVHEPCPNDWQLASDNEQRASTSCPHRIRRNMQLNTCSWLQWPQHAGAVGMRLRFRVPLWLWLCACMSEGSPLWGAGNVKPKKLTSRTKLYKIITQLHP